MKAIVCSPALVADSFGSIFIRLCSVLSVVHLSLCSVQAQLPPEPLPDPGGDENVAEQERVEPRSADPSVRDREPKPQASRRELPAPGKPDQRANQVRGGLTAMEALRRITEKFGASAISHVVEMTGRRGQAQPDSWKVSAIDLSNPFLVRTYAVDAIHVLDQGEDRSFYPDRPPLAFVSISKLAIGSHDAFIAIDKVAGAAKVGFDSIDFRLRGKEGNNEPIWSMTAVDRDGLPVGFVDVSGTTGNVLRTVWLRRAGARALPTVEDSALTKALKK